MKKAYLILGHLFFITLFYFAWTFYKERMLNADASFFSFRIIQSGTFDIELHRWGSAVSQIIPLLLLKTGCSLHTFLVSYSVSFIIIYYIIFLVITYGLKNYRAGIALMITLCLTFRHSFYYATAELYQGMAICILIWALIQKLNESDSKKSKQILLAIITALVYVVSYYHQLTSLALLFIIVFEMLNEKKLKDGWMVSLLLITFVWFFVRIKFLTTSEYESDKIPTLAVFMGQIGNIKTFESYTFLRHFARIYFLPFLLVMTAAGIFILRKKNWLLALFVPAFIAGFILLDVITYYKGESTLMYENYLVMLGLFAAVALCGVIKNLAENKIAIALIAIVLAWNLSEIYACSKPLSQGISYLDRLYKKGQQFPEKKYLIEKSNFPWDYKPVDWALPFETLLYSSLNGTDSSITVFSAKKINDYDTLIHCKNVFLCVPWSPTWFWTPNLNKNYFHVPDGDYRKIATLQSDTAFHESLLTKENVLIKPETETFYSTKDSVFVIPVRIINNSGNSIRSIPNIMEMTRLSYHVYRSTGEKIIQDGSRTTLETDIDKEAEMAIIVSNTFAPGNYIVEIDMVTENVRWFGINARVSLIVN